MACVVHLSFAYFCSDVGTLPKSGYQMTAFTLFQQSRALWVAGSCLNPRMAFATYCNSPVATSWSDLCTQAVYPHVRQLKDT